MVGGDTSCTAATPWETRNELSWAALVTLDWICVACAAVWVSTVTLYWTRSRRRLATGLITTSDAGTPMYKAKLVCNNVMLVSAVLICMWICTVGVVVSALVALGIGVQVNPSP